MIRKIAFALACIAAASPIEAQTATVIPDLSLATPIGGTWTYRGTQDGSEASFVVAGLSQVTIHCARATRRVSIAKTAGGAAPFLSVWTSSGSRTLPAAYTPANARLTVTVPAFDPLLDSMAFSRGRVGFVVAGSPALVVPSWAETARVVEDCRT